MNSFFRWAQPTLHLLTLLLFATPLMAAENLKEVLYAVSVNGTAVSDGTVFLTEEIPLNPPFAKGETKEPNLYVATEDLKSWRIRIPSIEGITYNGLVYYPLTAMKGVDLAVDEAEQAISLKVQAASMEETDIDGRPSFRVKPSTGTGLFLNYDLSDEGGDKRVNRLDGLFEAAFFGRYGVLLGTLSEQEIGERDRAIRLETTWQYDYVERRWSHRAGDSVTRGGAMGRAVRFGGVQWARNFSVEPGFITYPTIETIGGLAELPSALDVYINNVHSLSKELPAGPFELYNIPVVTGQGDIRIVVKDLLGREHIVTMPYYLSPLLLKKGLSDFSYEAGYRRMEYAVESDNYKDFLAVGTHRYGLTDTLTGELHLEYLSEQQTGSLTLVKLYPALGVFTAGAAGSRGDSAEGSQWLLGYEYADRGFNLGGSYRASTRQFRELGVNASLPQEYQAQAHTGLSLGRYGGAGLSYTEQREYDLVATKIITANYSVSIGPGQLALTGFRDVNDKDTYGMSAVYIVQLDHRRTLIAGANAQSDQRRDGLEVQQGLPTSGMGYSWRLRGERGDDSYNFFQGGLTREGQTNTATLELSRQGETDSYRAGISGGFAAMKQGVFAGRRINQSFAIAEVPGVSGVTVYADNQEVGQTDSKGCILVPNLRPYENNTITLNAEELPFDAELAGEAAETTAPFYRSGVVVPFKVKISRSAIIYVKTPDGKPLPAGAVVRTPGGSGECPVAKDGLVYLTELKDGENYLEAVVGERSYGFKVKAVPTTGEVQQLGTIVAMASGTEPSPVSSLIPAVRPVEKETVQKEEVVLAGLSPALALTERGNDESQKAVGDKPLPSSESENRYVIQETFLFGWNSWKLSPEGKRTLDGIFEKIGNNERAVIVAQLEGHADNIGTAKNNIKASLLRAKSIKNYLAGKGVDPAAITIKGFGEERPIASNKTREGRQKNRRVEITITGEESDHHGQLLPLAANKSVPGECKGCAKP